jgi:hypothetical protein
MSRVEDAVRETMRARDADAPAAAGFRFHPPTTPAHHRFRWVPAVAVAASVAIVIGIVVAVVPASPSRHTTAPPTAAVPVLDCPATWPAATSPKDLYPLPAARADALTVSDRLVPTTAPVHAVVCAYLHGNAGRLTGSNVLDSGLAAIPDTLAWLPPEAADVGCLDYIAPTDGDSYLIGLSYPTGTMWVAAPGDHCLGASNGRFATHTHVATEASSAYRTGRWTPPVQTQMYGCPVTPGRLGQERVLVPGTPVSVLVCATGGGQFSPHSGVSTSRAGTTADAVSLVAALNALPTQPDNGVYKCLVPKFGNPGTYIAVFGYRAGPPVAVSIPGGCGIANGNLQAPYDPGVVVTIKKILDR